METGHNDTAGLVDMREQMRIEFYATYDVMTGIRIAATLGGFFGLMVFLVIYKSRSKSLKALKDPKIAEIAAAVVAEEEAEEEERQLTYALEAALGARCSLSGSSGGWPPWPPRSPAGRFSSVGGGYSSLLAPPRRLTKLRGDSLPASSLHFHTPTFYEDDVEMGDVVDDPSCAVGRFLAVPGGGSRRFSNITCSSSGSSYLERRGSSLVCALPTLPPTPRTHRSSRRYTVHSSDPRDPGAIDIKVIQATPELSPCVSENTILEHQLRRPPEQLAAPGTTKPAPLASLGSCGASLSVDYQDYDLHSVGSDSVFDDDDTDDEVEQFSTDSDDSFPCRRDEVKELRPTRRRSRHIVGRSAPVTLSPPSAAVASAAKTTPSPFVRRYNSFLSRPITRRALRRLSHPTIIGRQGCSTISATVTDQPRRPEGIFSASSVPRTTGSQDVEMGYAELIAPSPSPLNPEHCSWSQETLF